MKYIITTVGTSAIEKSKVSIENFKDKNYDYWNNFSGDLTKKKKQLLEHFSKFDITKNEHLKNVSAEIKSLVKLKDKFKEDIYNYLIVSDTAECRLCAEFLKDYLQDKFNSDSRLVKIKGLRVDDFEKFQKEGMSNLVDELEKINHSHYGSKILLNITGGYKATISYLTILGQLWNIPLFYIFEELDNLIEIPKIPIDINWDLFNKYSREFRSLKQGEIGNWSDFKKKFEYNDLREIESLIYEYGNMAELSPIGRILWYKYEEKEYCSIPESSIEPDRKNHLRKWKQEPHRSKKFEKFITKLPLNKHINSFHYRNGDSPDKKKAEIVDNKIHVYYEGVVLEVEPTSSHPKHMEKIRKEIEDIFE